MRVSCQLPGELPEELPGELPEELSGELPEEVPGELPEGFLVSFLESFLKYFQRNPCLGSRAGVIFNALDVFSIPLSP